MAVGDGVIVFLTLLSQYNGMLSSSGYVGNCQWRAILTGDLLRRQDNVPDIQSCQNLCGEDTDCFVYTYLGNLVKHPGACFLQGKGYGPLRGYNHELVLKSGAITGILNCQETDSCLREGVIFTNGVIGNLEYISTLDKCLAACTANIACVLFSFYPDDRLCILRDESAVAVHKTDSLRVISGLLSCLTVTASAPGQDTLSRELENRDSDYIPTSRNLNDPEVFDDNYSLGDFDPSVSLLGELSEMSETEDQPYYLGNQANKGRNVGDKSSLWDSSIRRKSYSKGKSSLRRKSTAKGDSTVKRKPYVKEKPTIRRKSYSKVKSILKEESSVKMKSKEKSAEKRSECTLNLPGDKASTSDFPIPIGSEAVVYCKAEMRKNAVIKCNKARPITMDELPQCQRSYAFNSGHCGVYPPKGVVTYPNSTTVPVGGSLVATCLGSKDKPIIIPCSITKPITKSDYPSC